MNFALRDQTPATPTRPPPSNSTSTFPSPTRCDIRIWEVRTPWNTLNYISRAPKWKTDCFDLSAKKVCIPPSTRKIEAEIWSHVGLTHPHPEASAEEKMAAIDAAIAEACPDVTEKPVYQEGKRIYKLPEPLPPFPEEGKVKFEMFGRKGVWLDGGEKGMLIYWPNAESVIKERERVLRMRKERWYAIPIEGEEKRIMHGSVIWRKEIALMKGTGDE